MSKAPVALIILDGFAFREETKGNAVAQAKKPNFDRFWNQYPHAQLIASGEAVGLPEGQMGNSEVGHLNIGAGRVVYQSLTRVNVSIREGEFEKNETSGVAAYSFLTEEDRTAIIYPNEQRNKHKEQSANDQCYRGCNDIEQPLQVMIGRNASQLETSLERPKRIDNSQRQITPVRFVK